MKKIKGKLQIGALVAVKCDGIGVHKGIPYMEMRVRGIDEKGWITLTPKLLTLDIHPKNTDILGYIPE